MNLRQLKEQNKKVPCTSNQSIGDWKFKPRNRHLGTTQRCHWFSHRLKKRTRKLFACFSFSHNLVFQIYDSSRLKEKKLNEVSKLITTGTINKHAKYDGPFGNLGFCSWNKWNQCIEDENQRTIINTSRSGIQAETDFSVQNIPWAYKKKSNI